MAGLTAVGARALVMASLVLGLLAVSAVASDSAGGEVANDVARVRLVAHEAPVMAAAAPGFGGWERQDPPRGWFARDSFVYRANPDRPSCHWAVGCRPERDDPSAPDRVTRALAGWDVEQGTVVDRVLCYRGNYVKIGGPDSFGWRGWAPRSAVAVAGGKDIWQCEPWLD